MIPSRAREGPSAGARPRGDGGRRGSGPPGIPGDGPAGVWPYFLDIGHPECEIAAPAAPPRGAIRLRPGAHPPGARAPPRPGAADVKLG